MRRAQRHAPCRTPAGAPSPPLAEAGVGRVGIAATGGYERGVVAHLRAAGFTVLVLQPIQVRADARVRLRRAKNDALDAALVAACAANLDPPAIDPTRAWPTWPGT